MSRGPGLHYDHPGRVHRLSIPAASQQVDESRVASPLDSRHAERVRLQADRELRKVECEPGVTRRTGARPRRRAGRRASRRRTRRQALSVPGSGGAAAPRRRLSRLLRRARGRALVRVTLYVTRPTATPKLRVPRGRPAALELPPQLADRPAALGEHVVRVDRLEVDLAREDEVVVGELRDSASSAPLSARRTESSTKRGCRCACSTTNSSSGRLSSS